RAATAVKPGKDTKQDEGEEGRRCRKTKREEQRRDGDAYRNRNEGRFPNFLGLHIHDKARVTPNGGERWPARQGLSNRQTPWRASHSLHRKLGLVQCSC